MLITIMFGLPKVWFSDKELLEYVTAVEFMSRNNIRGDYIRIGFEDLPYGVAGRCYTLTNEITIDREVWNRVNKLTKIFLVAHELVHCYCGADHVELKYDKNICVTHFMSPTLMSDDCSNIKAIYYLNQLRTFKCRK